MTSFQHNREEAPVLPSAADLPGADTTAKRAAILTTDPRFQRMLVEAARLGWPAAFENDLYLHDRHILAAHSGQAMVWILRDHGTHLFPTECETSGEAHYARQVIHYWSGEHTLNASADAADAARCYLVTSHGLTPLDWRAAAESVTVREAGQ